MEQPEARRLSQRDMRERNANLQTSLDFAQSILDTVREPMLVLDPNLRVRAASRSFCQVFDVTASETEGQLIYELGNGQWDIPRLRVLLEEIIPQNTVFNDFEVEHIFPAIGRRVMLLNARKVWREGNRTENVLLAIEDITARKQAENKLALAHAQLEQWAAELTRSNEDLERFALVAAHDLKSPLSTITMFTEMLAKLKGDIGDATAQQYLDFVIQAGKRLGALISDLLKYAVLAQQPIGAPQTAAARTACALAHDHLEAAIAESNAELHCDIPASVTVPLSESLLVQMFQNLIGNAIHYRRQDVPPRITVTASPQGAHHWLFSVADNGIGIAQEHTEAIFQPFKRLHGPDVPGSGIGLATWERIVERAGGAIWVESRPGEGSTFYFLLPQA
jgi:PAS domain S-box-containing protein